MSGSRKNARSASTTYSHTANEDVIIEALLDGKYHLPNNSWCEDYIQYYRNNHPLIALCFQHRLHPIPRFMRFVGLVGSVTFGLCITNLCWIIYIYGKPPSEPMFTVSAGGVVVKNGTSYVLVEDESTIASLTRNEVSTETIILWTIGGIIHAFYDSIIFYAATCSCAYGSMAYLKDYKRSGTYFIISFVFFTLALGIALVIIRANLSQDETGTMDKSQIRSAGLMDDAIQVNAITDGENLQFLMSYAVELFLTWFVYFPLISTIMFTGCLSGCGRCRCPAGFFGGRPAELKDEEEAKRGRGSSRVI